MAIVVGAHSRMQEMMSGAAPDDCLRQMKCTLGLSLIRMWL